MFVFKAAVVGAGTMGGEIAQVIASAGIPVVLKDVKQEFVDTGLEKARQVTEAQLGNLVNKEKITQEDADSQREEILGRIAGTTDYDGFGHVAKLEGDWPRPGARLLWESRPGGRGLVNERVTAYEPGRGQTLEVEDEQMQATQTVFFEPAGDRVRVTLGLDYRLKRRFTPLLVRLFTRRALRASLQRTLARFARELG